MVKGRTVGVRCATDYVNPDLSYVRGEGDYKNILGLYQEIYIVQT